MLGVTPTRYSAEGKAPYVARTDADERICELLAETGPPYPFVIVWGTTKAGKSRTLAEALRATFADDTPVVLARDGKALADLAGLGLGTLVDKRPSLVVLDDIGPAGLEALTADVLDRVRECAVIAATMTAQRRASVLVTGSEVGVVARAALGAASGEYELASEPPKGSEKAEAERLYPEEHFEGSIAETLVGARELIARYKASHDSDPAGCAIVRAAIDARRAGLSRPVTNTELRRLFPLYLHAVRIDLLPTNEEFTRGVNWAIHPVTSQVALLRRTSSDHGELAWAIFDHAVTADEGHGGHRVRSIPSEMWAELIDIVPPHDSFGVGIAAYGRHELAAAVTAFSKAAASENAPAALALGLVLAERGDFEDARAAYQQAIDSGHLDYEPMAAFNLGIMLAERGDFEGARAAYQQAIDSGHADHAPAAAVALGIMLAERGDFEGARAAYQQAIDSGHADHAPAAAVALGILLAKRGDFEGARAAYRQAIDSGHADHASKAAVNLGLLMAERGDFEGARAAYQQAIDSGHADHAPLAALALGILLVKQGDTMGAHSAYRQAIDSGHAEHAPVAETHLRILLRERADEESAVPATGSSYQFGLATPRRTYLRR